MKKHSGIFIALVLATSGLSGIWTYSKSEQVINSNMVLNNHREDVSKMLIAIRQIEVVDMDYCFSDVGNPWYLDNFTQISDAVLMNGITSRIQYKNTIHEKSFSDYIKAIHTLKTNVYLYSCSSENVDKDTITSNLVDIEAAFSGLPPKREFKFF